MRLKMVVPPPPPANFFVFVFACHHRGWSYRLMLPLPHKVYVEKKLGTWGGGGGGGGCFVVPSPSAHRLFRTIVAFPPPPPPCKKNPGSWNTCTARIVIIIFHSSSCDIFSCPICICLILFSSFSRENSSCWRRNMMLNKGSELRRGKTWVKR